ncbi:nucleic acid dioxygenase ALKBH1 [Stomoxys calcitrans]|uniref:Fe2OG dioxygenase domain-containing protein n=1 Tax=Stomoxys calcitrans TaxID=35570 RepID=A0A1I8Q4B3_STOCA|nr:nucleic acid dioxygenase ALKBH1 [Stomoxys calcitrans]XP_013101548.1 nucleic acid dioxygenase ALKBH1 [Stomoxys calcitrans]
MFKESFKYYKSKWPIPNLTSVIDFRERGVNEIQELHLNDCDCASLGLPLGLNPVHCWRIFTLNSHPGLLIIRHAFTTLGQRYWMARSLKDYPKAPNRVNLNERLFQKSVLDDWWFSLQSCEDKDESRRMKISMRWTTLGYHHDWDTKIYSEDLHTKFPEDLSKLSSFFANILGYNDYQAQAAIVNYYPIGTTLAGHTDHSEQNLEAPLFSFSFGQTAIFLIGGKTREEKPTALFIESGDVLVMSKESRLCYHAVPRVMKAREETWNCLIESTQPKESSVEPPVQPSKRLRTEVPCIDSRETSAALEWAMDPILYNQVADEIFWSPFKSYLHDSRINLNVRQVLHRNRTTLNGH